MAKTTPAYDVFVSHSQRDAGLVAEIARIMRSYDLTVFTNADMTAGERLEDQLWEAIAESQAFVAVVPEAEPIASIAFELGAAKAWNKPVYAIASNPSSTHLAVPLGGLMVYSPSRIEEIAQDIKRSLGSLSDSEKSVLIDEYHRIGEPVDELLLQPKHLSRLTKQFHKRTRRQVTSEELVRMLLRLRKQGALRVAIKKRPKAG
jgi:TIR domain